MGEIVATQKITRLRPDGVVQEILIEIDRPEEHTLIAKHGVGMWTCNVRIGDVTEVLTVSGMSSLNAIVQASYLASKMVNTLPFASEFVEKTLPNLGFPLCPITTTPEELDKHQKIAIKHKEARAENKVL